MFSIINVVVVLLLSLAVVVLVLLLASVAVMFAVVSSLVLVPLLVIFLIFIVLVMILVSPLMNSVKQSTVPSLSLLPSSKHVRFPSSRIPSPGQNSSSPSSTLVPLVMLRLRLLAATLFVSLLSFIVVTIVIIGVEQVYHLPATA